MIKVVLIDDEKPALQFLGFLLSKIDDVQILDIIQDSRLAKNRIIELKPDLIFLDIEMPHIDGFELLASFDELPFKVVFTTAYNQYALKALKMNAFDYLMKPLELSELQDTLEKFRNNEIETTTDQVAHLTRFNVSKMEDTLALSTQKGLIFINTNDIMYLTAHNAYTFVYLEDGQSHLVSKTMAVFEEVLQDNPLFFRSHKSNIVNLKFIKQYNRGEGGELIMRNGESLVLSRSKKQDFLSLFKKI